MTPTEIKQQLQSLLDERAKITDVPRVWNMETDLDNAQANGNFVQGVKKLLLEIE